MKQKSIVPPRDLLTPREAADFAGYSESTLARLRLEGSGPRFLKPSPRKVFYRRSDIELWLSQSERQVSGKKAEAGGLE